jgi:hypothetical protein
VAEGVKSSEWILLDYFNFVVHIFSRECRSFYGLERLWGNADRYDFSDESRLRRCRAARSASSTLSLPSPWRRTAPRAAAFSTIRSRAGVPGLLASVSGRRCRRRAACAASRCPRGAPSVSPPNDAPPAAAGRRLRCRRRGLRLRRRGAGHHSRAEVRRTPVAGASARCAAARAGAR